MNGLRLLLAGAFLLLLGALASPAALAADGISLKWEWIPPPRGVMHVSLDVLVDGSPVRLVSHHGKLYLPVTRMGAEYEIRVNNHGPRRISAIVSVDGLSVLDGRPASEERAGYLVDPYSNVVIKGWRRDREKVAAFTFEPREKSYAFRMGHGSNIGVIGLIAFEELTPRPRPLMERDSLMLPKSARSDTGGTGTGWGRDIDSPVHKVPFVRSSNKRTVTLYYDTVEALRRAGVPVDGYPPLPFPGDPEYCPPPPRG